MDNFIELEKQLEEQELEVNTCGYFEAHTFVMLFTVYIY